jgi:hypothetical protein
LEPSFYPDIFKHEGKTKILFYNIQYCSYRRDNSKLGDITIETGELNFLYFPVQPVLAGRRHPGHHFPLQNP